MNVSLIRETAHRWAAHWRVGDMVIVEKVSGPDLDDAVANATRVLAVNGLTVVDVTVHPATGNATLEVTS